VLSKVVTSASIPPTQQAREMLCLPLRFKPVWFVAGIAKIEINGNNREISDPYDHKPQPTFTISVQLERDSES
jgi:hypothetical protein